MRSALFSFYVSLAVFWLPINAFSYSELGNEETLKALYLSAKTPAQVKDFPTLDISDSLTNPLLRCVVAYSESYVPELRIFNGVRINPGNGPLIPEKKETKLVFGPVNNDSFDHISTTHTSTDLVIVNPYAYTNYSDLDPQTGAALVMQGEVSIRKRGPYLPFKYRVINRQGETFLEKYGYCYETLMMQTNDLEIDRSKN